MDKLVIQGPAKLSGKVAVSGSKNTALPFLFSSLLFDSEIRFTNVPRLWDVETTLQLLENMGCQYQWNKEGGEVTLHPRAQSKVAPYEYVKKMRAGILALGPLVAKYGEARVSLPGGCAIGARPVNFHIEALRKLGVKVEVEEGYIKAAVLKRLQGAEIVFPEVTVTGTENLLFVAAFAEGTTVLENAAREPEVVAVGELLREAGIAISGLGTSRIEIQGGKLKHLPTIRIPSDRIETGTWVAIAMATGSELILENAAGNELDSVLKAYQRMGLKIESSNHGQTLRVIPQSRYEAIQLETEPYPGFPTDMQAQILTNMCQAHGVSRLRENIFENRFMHVAELQRLGAKIKIEGNLAIVEGGSPLRGAPMMATDLRASASLVVAALMAQGTTSISRIYHLDRGYQRLDEKLRKLGAGIQRVAE